MKRFLIKSEIKGGSYTDTSDDVVEAATTKEAVLTWVEINYENLCEIDDYSEKRTFKEFELDMEEIKIVKAKPKKKVRGRKLYG